MPDSIGANGLTIATASEITQKLVTGLQGIYGSDINTDSNSPDGQMIGILTQMAIDLRELLVSINASFDPDQAVGTLLDQRVAINNIQRIGGSYTVQSISIVATQTVTLQGLDANYNNPNGTGYTVQDSNGNQFILAATTTINAGTTALDFRAQQIGMVDVDINTITNPVTIIVGVSSVNNPTVATTVGKNQESDQALRVRRAQSVANASEGYLNGLLGKILELPGVTEAVLYENIGATPDANGIPGHSIWLVVAGGANSDIANTIYNSKSYGAGMKGSVSYNIITPSGSTFIARWDNPIPEPLYIQFTIKRTVTGFGFSESAIKSYMAANLIYGIGAFAETSEITSVATDAIAAQGGGGKAVLVSISSDGVTYTDYLDPTTPQYEFVLSAANISISIV